MSPGIKFLDSLGCKHHTINGVYCKHEAIYFYFLSDEIGTELVLRCHEHKWIHGSIVRNGWKILSKEEALCAMILHT